MLLDPVGQEFDLGPREAPIATDLVDAGECEERAAGQAQLAGAAGVEVEALVGVLREAGVAEVPVLTTLVEFVQVEGEDAVTEVSTLRGALQVTIDPRRGESRLEIDFEGVVRG